MYRALTLLEICEISMLLLSCFVLLSTNCLEKKTFLKKEIKSIPPSYCCCNNRKQNSHMQSSADKSSIVGGVVCIFFLSSWWQVIQKKTKLFAILVHSELSPTSSGTFSGTGMETPKEL